MEDFVSFEISKKLKEKGFDKYCCRAYNEIGCFNDTDTYKYSGEFYCYAPQISQVLKWLREEKKISVEVGIHCSLKWMCSIYGFSDGLTDFTQYNNDGIDDTIFILYDSLELAAIAGIEYCLDNLI